MISEVATSMFERDGFDTVSIAQVAAEAGVAKMTVTNYFGRKEDLVFDRAEIVIGSLAKAVASRAEGESALSAVRRDFLDGVRTRSPLVGYSRIGFARLVEDSPVLSARFREMLDLRDRALADRLRDAFGVDDVIAQFRAAQLGSVQRILATDARKQIIGGATLDELQVWLETNGTRMFELLKSGTEDD
jgi:AcrR family transcriptional regulator